MTVRKELLRRFLAALNRAHEDEEGSSMVFGALTLFTLALFTVMVWVVGMNSGDHIQNQTGADSAAYSGALVEAEALESIAFLNDGMAFVYYTELRYAIDAIVYSTLECFAENDRFQGPQTIAQQQTQGSPWVIVEPFSAYYNNPGARANGDYFPGIENGGQVNASDSNGYPSPRNQPQDYGFVEMGSAGGNKIALFQERYDNSVRRARTLIPQGKRWLADIHFAERIILAATPRLVKKACIRVGLANGAEWVAVSTDLDDAFGDERTIGPGFTEDPNSQGVNHGMARRYTEHKANPIDGVARKLPPWFNEFLGQSNGADAGGTYGYQQIRLCWNRRDWDHCDVQGNYSDHGNYPLSSGSPVGHWHVAHVHGIDRYQQDPNTGQLQYAGTDYAYGALGAQGPFTHDFGHGIQSGPDAGHHQFPDQTQHVAGYTSLAQMNPPLATFGQDDLNAFDQDHHAAQTCPTCSSWSSDGRWAEVPHYQPEGEMLLQSQEGLDPRQATQIHFNGPGEVTPRPLLLKGAALRAGVTVATWRHSRGLGTAIFPANDWGDLAIASAQIGLRDPNTGVVAVAQSADDRQAIFARTTGQTTTLSLDDQNPNGQNSPDNLYLGVPGDPNDPGMRFGARLVRVRRGNTWSGLARSANPGSGLQALLYGDRWWDAIPQNFGPNGGGTTPDLQNQATKDLYIALQNLRRFVIVPNQTQDLAQ